MAEPIYTVASDSDTTDIKPPFYSIEGAIGIDLGTSQCSVAIWNGSNIELLKNIRNQKQLRSYVMFKTDIPSGGMSEEVAHKEQEILSGSAIFNIMRLIGRMDTDPIVQSCKAVPFLIQTLGIGVRPLIAALVNGVWRSTTPEEVLAIFLVELRVMAEAQFQKPIRNAILTIPISFNRFQQTRVERACAMAGLHVIRLIPEPTAVALLYAHKQQQTIWEHMGSGIEKNAVIFSMGAGYCDVAVTVTAGGVSEIKSLAGSTIGGEDILQNVMHYLLPDLDTMFTHHTTEEIESMALLRIITQEAIHKLSFQTSVSIDVDLRNGLRISRTLSRAELESANSNVFETCEGLVKTCLCDAKMAVENINDVILVGGCSIIPRIQSLVLGLCEKDEPCKDIDPLEAAVYGVALEGAVASGLSDSTGSLDLLTIHATPLSLGIQADGDNFIPIMHRNTPVPARKDVVFTTTSDNQTEALIIVYEGEGKSLEKNQLLGFFKVTGIPPSPKGTAMITVSMDIDASNILRVIVGIIPADPQKNKSPPLIEVRMPTLDDGHGWCIDALHKMYGSALGLVTVPKKLQQS